MSGRKKNKKTRSRKGKLNSNFKGGKTLIKHYCIEKNCNNEICLANFYYGNKRCKSCARKLRIEEKSSHYIDGRTKAKHYCIEEDCNNEITYQTWKYGKGRCRYCANKGKRSPNFGKIGKEAYNYVHGKGYEPYPLEFNNQLKESIRKRDDYICQKCFITEEEHLIVYGIKLGIHHIDYNKKNCNKDNLITLCNECNTRVNANRTYWTDYFREGKKIIKRNVTKEE